MITAENMYKAFLRGTDALAVKEKLINKANVFPVPDGDTGTNMLMTLKNALNKTQPPQNVSDFGKSFSYNILRSARGNSGVILSVAVTAFFDINCKDKNFFSPEDIKNGLVNAKNAVYSTVSSPQEGTILTLFRALSDSAQNNYKTSRTDKDFLINLLRDAKFTLENACCESYEQKKTALPDSGALGLYCMTEGMINSSETIYSIQNENPIEKESSSTENYSEKPYCTQFIVEKNNNPSRSLCEDFTLFLKSVGESVLVVDNPAFIKVHLHTDRPGEILTRALEIGSLSEIEIDNMLLQSKKTNETKTGITAIYSGKGVRELFETLGVESFVNSDDSYNPETAQILSELEKSDCGKIILITNHKNCVLAAKQAAKLTDKKVNVIPAHSVGEQLAAISVFNENDTFQENTANLTKAISTAKSVDISIASKDAVIDKVKIKTGQYISFAGKQLIANEDSLSLTAIKSAKFLLGKSHRSLTLIFNDEISEEQAEKIKAKIENSFSRKTDISVLYGGQKIYCLSVLAD